ncbi:MAG: hypothetical protein V2I43_25375 [Parvularcula sp.]|jgi:hypothetical protein|nr:hypothetical protein [Parvularcula sp.]
MSEKRIRELFSLTPVQQIRHWAGPDPWEDMKLENKVEISVNSVLRNAQCNITRMPLLMKPCFGQPTAFARHGGHQPIFNPRFGSVKSRCMRCNAQQACDHVAKARLNATPELRDAYIRFGKAGASFGLKNPSDCPTANREFEGLVRALVAHGGFTNVNETAALEELDRREAERKIHVAEKKRVARRKAIRRGHLPDEFIELLSREKDRRSIELALVLHGPRQGLPSNIAKLPYKSVEITADVWFVREILRLTKEEINPCSIARALKARRPSSYRTANLNSLRQRTESDLRRVATLERHVIKGRAEAIWPAFDLKAALDELDLITPYTPDP